MKLKIINLGNPFLIRIEDDFTGLISKGGNIYRFDEISVDILKSLDKTLCIKDTIRHICALYNVEKNILKKDINEFLKKLKSEKIIGENFETIIK